MISGRWVGGSVVGGFIKTHCKDLHTGILSICS